MLIILLVRQTALMRRLSTKGIKQFCDNRGLGSPESNGCQVSQMYISLPVLANPFRRIDLNRLLLESFNKNGDGGRTKFSEGNYSMFADFFILISQGIHEDSNDELRHRAQFS
jgi:hypothetical protein